jgi:hypothetical protein
MLCASVYSYNEGSIVDVFLQSDDASTIKKMKAVGKKEIMR